MLLKLAAVPSYVLCAAVNGGFLPRLLLALGEPQKGTADTSDPVLLGFYCRAEGLSGPRAPANPPNPLGRCWHSCRVFLCQEQRSQTVLPHRICFSMPHNIIANPNFPVLALRLQTMTFAFLKIYYVDLVFWAIKAHIFQVLLTVIKARYC